MHMGFNDYYGINLLHYVAGVVFILGVCAEEVTGESGDGMGCHAGRVLPAQRRNMSKRQHHWVSKCLPSMSERGMDS